MEFFLKYKKPFLFAAIAVTALMSFGLTFLGTDFSFDSFFPRDEEYDFFEEYQKTFPKTSNVYFIALENNGNTVLEASFLEDVDSLFNRLGRLPNVDTVISPIHFPSMRRTPGGVKSEDLIDYSSPKALLKTRKRLDRDTVLAENFFAKDYSIICGVVGMEASILDFPERDTLTWAIEKELADLPFKAVFTGVPAIRTGFIVKINKESVLFIGLSVLLTLIVLIFTYRSLWGVIVPLLGVMITVIWCMGLMGLFNKKIDLMFMLLPSIIFVVATSALVHLVTKYIQELETGKSPGEAIKSTIQKIGMAIFLTNLTTAIGFASLTISVIPPMRDFGIFSALGVLFAFVVAMIIGPNILPIISPPKLVSKKGVGNLEIWEKLLTWLDHFTKSKPLLIAAIFAGVILISVVGMSMVSFNTYLMEDMPKGDPVRENLEYLENNFAGISPLEVAILVKDGHKVTELEILKDLDKVEDFIRSRTQASTLLSPGTFLKSANKLNHFGRNKYFRLPKSQAKVDEIINYAIVAGGDEILGSVMNDDYSLARISGRMNDIGTDEFSKFNAAVFDFVQENCDTTKFNIRMTGTAVLAEQNVLHFRSALFNGLMLAFVVIGLIMGLLFRSWKMLFVALIPNLIPLLFCAGMMGLLGRSLTTSASIVFVMSFGIAVDDTIHFLSRFKQELKGGASLDTAVRNTLLGTGKALIITTIILMGGFIMLTFSSFGGVFVVGLFVCLTLLMGLLSDLLLMPVLVRWVYNERSGETSDKSVED